MAQVIYNQFKEKLEKPCIITIGTFDGVHLGHRHLFDKLNNIAKDNGAISIVVTFLEHPLQTLRPELQVRLLTTNDEKFRLLEQQPIDFVLALNFNEKLSALTAQEFISFLREQFPIIGIITGYDNVIGSDRMHGCYELQDLCRCLNLKFYNIEQLKLNGEPVGSTQIRGKIINDELKTAARLLGRPYSITGVVEHGLRAGKGKMGIPTANLIIPAIKLLPSDGVYAAKARWGNQTAVAATNIMYARLQPDNDKLPPNLASLKNYTQLTNEPKLVETYLINVPFDTNLYDEEIEIQLLKRIRGLVQFDNWTDLKHQIIRDIDKINKEVTLWDTKEFL